MDRMYRWTRHVYDLTRRYYLLGRDDLLRDIAVQPPATVLEMGCGTARNLRHLAGLAPQHTLYGVDASNEMLDTARQSLHRAGCADRVHLQQGLAEDLDMAAQFGTDAPLDVLFFSYVLSMIPTWPAALDAALDALRPGGRLYVVDFWDQADLPRGFATLLQRWLALFHVHHRPELLDAFRRLEQDGRVSLQIESVARRYAYRATLVKRNA
jgi:S-adenosylmethionine-diacylgycerolhomoserine-N-methlytransferase